MGWFVRMSRIPEGAMNVRSHVPVKSVKETALFVGSYLIGTIMLLLLLLFQTLIYNQTILKTFEHTPPTTAYTGNQLLRHTITLSAINMR